MGEALEPCLFCGDSACMVDGDGRFYVACNGSDCFCCVGEAYDRSAMPEHIFATADDAITAWNRRAPDPIATLRRCRDMIAGLRATDFECFTVAGIASTMDENEAAIIAEYDGLLAEIREVIGDDR